MSAPNVEAHVEKAQKALADGQRVLVRGPAGSGRRTLAEQLAAREASSVVIDLLEAHEADAVPAALLPMVSALDDESERSRLVEGMRDAGATARAVMGALAASRRPLIVSVPGSWRFVAESASDDDVPSEHAVKLLQALSSTDGPVLFLTEASRNAADFGFIPQVEISLERQKVTLAALEHLWGAYAPHAERLQSGVGTDAQANAMIWRLAVGATALGADVAEIRLLCEQPMGAAINPLATKVGRLAAQRGLGVAILRVLLCRRPIPGAELRAVSHIAAEHLPLLAQCIGYGDPVRFSGPVRSALFAAIDGPSRAIATGDQIHCDLAHFHQRFDGAADPTDVGSFGEAVAWIERVHHLAHGGQRAATEWSGLRLPAPEFYWDRARAMSHRGLLRPAAAVYDQCRKRFPEDDYSHHYFAWNLDQAGDRSEAVQSAYERAVHIAPSHVWWNARLVQYLIRGRDPVAARDRWAKALENVDPDGSEVSRSPYVAENMHLWVAAEWLRGGRWQAARRTLEAIPTEMRQRLGERFATLETSIQVCRETEGRLFVEWLDARPGAQWSAARAWWALALQSLPHLPAPAADDSAEGGAMLTWSASSICVEVEFTPTGTMNFFASERPVERGRYEGEEDLESSLPDTLRRWLERVTCT